jgi:hypothetical protein
VFGGDLLFMSIHITLNDLKNTINDTENILWNIGNQADNIEL